MLDLLNTAVGVLVFYSLLSVVASALAEMLFGILRVRGRILFQAVVRICGGSYSLAVKVYEHPLIAPLSPSQGKTRLGASWHGKRLYQLLGLEVAPENCRQPDGLPSYIQSATYARAMVETVYSCPVEEIDDLSHIPSGVCGDGLALVRRTFTTFAGRAGGDMEVFLGLVANQFDQVNERAAGWFRRVNARLLFSVGLVMALFLNADSLRIFQKLRSDTAYRNELVKYAAELSTESGATETAQKSDHAAGRLRTKLLDDLEKSEMLTGGWRDDPLVEFLASPRRPNVLMRWGVALAGLLCSKLVGFLLTALAVSLGAPFWFDMLRKVMKIRASVAPQDSPAAQEGKEAGNAEGAGMTLPMVGGRRLRLTGPDPAVVAEAARFAQLSLQAYGNEREFALWLRSWEDGSVSLVENGFLDAGRHRLVDTQLYVLSSPGRVMVVFRGTQELLDWWTNAQTRLVPMRFTRSGRDVAVEGAFVHHGFQTALQVAWTGILERLASAVGEGAEQREVVFAGHSLGGALAVLTAMRWQWEKARAAADAPCYQGTLAGVYTIGQPRLGDKGFAGHGRSLLGDCYVRAVNNRDVVPRVPPGKVGFEHFGTLHYYDEGGTLRVDPSTLVQVVDVALADWAGEHSVETLKEFEADHSADRYVALYEKQVAALGEGVAA